MEVLVVIRNMKQLLGLNPYCNERYSWRCCSWNAPKTAGTVLILIVMKDTHGVYYFLPI